MPSDKHNSIMAIDFSLFNIASSSDVYFCRLQQLQYLHHGTTKLTFFLRHSFIHYLIGDNLWYVCYGFGERLRQVQFKQGHFLSDSLLGILAKRLKR